MTLVVADTSSLVSLGTVVDREPSPIEILIDNYEVAIPPAVVAEMEETASYDDPQGGAAQAVLDRLDDVATEDAGEDAAFPLDEGENAAVALANARDAELFLCDEFNAIGLIHASLAGARLVTTPTLLRIFVRGEALSRDEALALLEHMIDVRSWDGNSYVQRVIETFSS